MKKYALALISLVAAVNASTAFAEVVLCKVKVNTAEVSLKKVDVKVGDSEVFAENSGFRFRVKNYGMGKFELDVFDPATPSRNYAEGLLKSATDEVGWALWTRDILLEASCKLAE
jgi:hypothetical protein